MTARLIDTSADQNPLREVRDLAGDMTLRADRIHRRDSYDIVRINT